MCWSSAPYVSSDWYFIFYCYHYYYSPTPPIKVSGRPLPHSIIAIDSAHRLRRPLLLPLVFALSRCPLLPSYVREETLQPRQIIIVVAVVIGEREGGRGGGVEEEEEEEGESGMVLLFLLR